LWGFLQKVTTSNQNDDVASLRTGVANLGKDEWMKMEEGNESPPPFQLVMLFAKTF
jgi:hypothetical protein